MRMHRHDFRDMALAFGLSFDLKRVTQATLALSWTLLVVVGVVGIYAWRVSKGTFLSAEGLHDAWHSVAHSPLTPGRLLLWLSILGGWWVGFAYLCAPIQRSAAMDIALDERDAECNFPVLNRQAALSPVLTMLLPALALLAALIWSLLTYIPGMAGAVIASVTLPLVIAVTAAGAAFLLVGLLAAPMMAPTAVIEGRDYLEAISRPMSYVMQRPGRYLAYWTAKLGVLAASAVAGLSVFAVAWAMVAAALWVIGQGELASAACAEAMATGTGEFRLAPAAFGIGVVFWSTAFVLIAWLIVVALSADTLIYLLMRYRVDGVTFDKITIAEQKLAALKTAEETATEAEAARKRFDEQQAEVAAKG